MRTQLACMCIHYLMGNMGFHGMQCKANACVMRTLLPEHQPLPSQPCNSYSSTVNMLSWCKSCWIIFLDTIQVAPQLMLLSHAIYWRILNLLHQGENAAIEKWALWLLLEAWLRTSFDYLHFFLIFFGIFSWFYLDFCYLKGKPLKSELFDSSLTWLTSSLA